AAIAQSGFDNFMNLLFFEMNELIMTNRVMQNISTMNKICQNF
ncbi:MAG: hypothetical protein ACJARE_002910, partial [Paracoccaceae bacterium]